jgi:hypothetical protein
VAVKAGTRLQHQCDDDDDDDDDLLNSILSTELRLFSTAVRFGCLHEPKQVALLNKGPIYGYYICSVVFVG